jgi:hypothetical protein
LAARGRRESRAAEVAANSPSRCDLLGCIGKVKGKTIALIRHPAALEEDCRAPTSSPPFSVGKGCSTARLLVDRRVLQAEGAHALYIQRGLSIRSESVAETRGRRTKVRPMTKMIAASTAIPMSSVSTGG